MNFSRIKYLTKSFKLLTNHNLNRKSINLVNKFKYNRYENSQHEKFSGHQYTTKTLTGGGFILGATIFSWNPFKKSSDDEDSPENQLIMNIKRSILCIQKGEYKKAEQMLHLALRMAQDLNSKEGITYIYDVLANLAMEAKDFIKAEKLFVNVMTRLMSEGVNQDDNKILHISSKIAHMAHLQENFEKASQGFTWTLDKIEEKLKAVKDDEDLVELYGLTKNWYGQLLMDKDQFAEAKKYFAEAYEIYTKIHGKINEEAIMMLNNLAVVCISLNEMESAEEYLNKAIEYAKEIPEMIEIGIFYANLGLVYMKKGLLKQAKEVCGLGWRLGKKINNPDVVEQADYCLEQLKLFSE